MWKSVCTSARTVHALGTLVVGMAFGAGWSPCVGPLLGSILALAASQGTVGQGMLLLAIYSLGLAIPFLVLSLFAHLVLAFVKRGTKVILVCQYNCRNPHGDRGGAFDRGSTSDCGVKV
jgi:cytochrome c-type biogenesis protein